VSLEWIRGPCPTASASHRASAQARQKQLTKPLGSLGLLEAVVIELAALQRTEAPVLRRAPIVIFAGDHGVTAQGVSAYPAEVTVQMLRNFASGGAAISVLARELGSSLEIVDVGTFAGERIPGVTVDKPRCGTRDFSQVAALTPAEVDFALECGRRAVARQAGMVPHILILGEMGIGNTAAASAVASALLACPPEEMTGSGTGIDAGGVARKAGVIAAALERHHLKGASAEEVLAAVGGLEIIALAGAMITAAQFGIPVLVDGFIVSVAALAATRLNAACRDWMLFSHRSAERGHGRLLDALGARPILNLDLRLGEASGAALALPTLRLACALHNGMATFAEAAVSQRSA
jgi:nicotinate-nucleotide--dimethylbenzimidazole phosphoribosyltransferase